MRRSRMWSGLFEDLNAPNALLVSRSHPANAELDRRGSDRESLERARAAFARINGVLDIVPERTVEDPDLVVWVEERIAARRAAREARNFAEADRIRAELGERGVVIEDGPGGTKWKPAR